MRAATFVVSPTAVYSTRRSEPTLPDITRPEFRPMPMRNPDPSSCSRSHPLKRGKRTASISRAVESARSAWSVCTIGAPNTAMIPSPMYATSVPPWSRIASLISLR